MSGTAAKITGFVCENGATVASGTTLRFKWSPYSGADEIQLQGAPDGVTWQPWHRVTGTATATTKGGVTDGTGWKFRVVARRGGREITGSASDPVAVRVGPAPAPTAADFAALRDRVAALEKALAAPIRGAGTMTVAVEGQTGEGNAKIEMLLTPQTAP